MTSGMHSRTLRSRACSRWPCIRSPSTARLESETWQSECTWTSPRLQAGCVGWANRKHDMKPMPRWKLTGRLPVMLPRETDDGMRRDGSGAASLQHGHAVDERGRLHGVPALPVPAGLSALEWDFARFTAIEERRR